MDLRFQPLAKWPHASKTQRRVVFKASFQNAAKFAKVTEAKRLLDKHFEAGNLRKEARGTA